MDDKTIKTKRKALYKFVENLTEKTGMQPTDTVPDNAFIVCVATKDFDEDGNLLWQDSRNKSYPTDYKCYKCQEKVSMSTGGRHMYEEAKKEQKLIWIVCPQCLLKDMEEHDTN